MALYPCGSSNGGGGGSTVVPNPTGEAVGELTSIGIDGSKYSISGGGGAYTTTVLFTNGASGDTTFQLSSAYTNFDAIAIYYSHFDGQDSYEDVRTYPTSFLNSVSSTDEVLGFTNDAWYYYFSVYSTTEFRYVKSNAGYITDIIGIKYGSNSGGGAVTGVKGSAESTYRTGNVDISASNIGLGNVDNTADLNKPISTATQTALNGKVNTSSVGSANGVAELDANGRVPSSQLPSYVDDVLEYADLAHFPATGETGKIYIAEDTNKTYRWSGSDYAEISESLALGETSSTAYAGNKGKANADAIAAIKDGANIDSFGDVETALAGKADVSALANYASLDNSVAFPDANNVNKELVYINGFQSGLTNYPSEVSNTVGILLTRWFYYSGDLTVPRMQLVFTLLGKSFCRFFDGTSWTSWLSNGVGNLNALTTTDKGSCVGAINEVNRLAVTYGIYTVNNATDVKDFIKKAIQQAHSDLATKNPYTLYNIFATYPGLDNYYGRIERQNTAGYAFSFSKASGDNIYQGYYDISSDYINVIRFDGTAI